MQCPEIMMNNAKYNNAHVRVDREDHDQSFEERRVFRWSVENKGEKKT